MARIASRSRERGRMKYLAFGDFLRKTMQEKAVKQVDLAAKVGVTSQAVSQWVGGKTMPSRDMLPRIAQALGIEMEQLTSFAYDSSQARGVIPLDRPTPSGHAIPSNVEPAPAQEPLLGRADLPVYASAEGGEGETIVTYEPVDYISRPSMLEHVRDAFAVYAVNDSMAPRFESGDLLLVNPSKPVRPGNDVLIVLSQDGIEHSMLVKRLVRRTKKSVVVRQYNPDREFEIDANKVMQLMRIVGTYTD